MNQLCYCKSKLAPDTVRQGDKCSNCCQTLEPGDDEILYYCENANATCLYQSIAAQPYVICSDCHDINDDEQKNQDDLSWISRKITQSLHVISYVT